MDVDIEKSGRDHGVAEIYKKSVGRNFFSGALRKIDNLPILHHKERIPNILARSEKPGCDECGFHVR